MGAGVSGFKSDQEEQRRKFIKQLSLITRRRLAHREVDDEELETRRTHTADGRQGRRLLRSSSSFDETTTRRPGTSSGSLHRERRHQRRSAPLETLFDDEDDVPLPYTMTTLPSVRPSSAGATLGMMPPSLSMPSSLAVSPMNSPRDAAAPREYEETLPGVGGGRRKPLRPLRVVVGSGPLSISDDPSLRRAPTSPSAASSGPTSPTSLSSPLGGSLPRVASTAAFSPRGAGGGSIRGDSASLLPSLLLPPSGHTQLAPSSSTASARSLGAPLVASPSSLGQSSPARLSPRQTLGGPHAPSSSPSKPSGPGALLPTSPRAPMTIGVHAVVTTTSAHLPALDHTLVGHSMATHLPVFEHSPVAGLSPTAAATPHLPTGALSPFSLTAAHAAPAGSHPPASFPPAAATTPHFPAGALSPFGPAAVHSPAGGHSTASFSSAAPSPTPSPSYLAPTPLTTRSASSLPASPARVQPSRTSSFYTTLPQLSTSLPEIASGSRPLSPRSPRSTNSFTFTPPTPGSPRSTHLSTSFEAGSRGGSDACVDLTLVQTLLMEKDMRIAELQRAVEDRERQRLAEISELRQAVENLQDTVTCQICLARPKRLAWGCGHVFCVSCTKAMMACPFCRAPRKHVGKIYLN